MPAATMRPTVAIWLTSHRISSVPPTSAMTRSIAWRALDSRLIPMNGTPASATHATASPASSGWPSGQTAT